MWYKLAPPPHFPSLLLPSSYVDKTFLAEFAYKIVFGVQKFQEMCEKLLQAVKGRKNICSFQSQFS
jgi:hypothetical protein